MLSRFEEITLITRCIATDDRDAFGRLVVEHQEGLRRFILHLTGGDASLTDDIAQETFLKAFLSIKSFKALSRFRTWLFQIAYNQYITELRHQSRYSDEPVDDLSPALQPAQASDEAAIDATMDVEECLKSLSPKERSVTLLFYLEGLPIKQIAKITDIPEGSIKVYLSRSRTKMSQFLIKDSQQNEK